MNFDMALNASPHSFFKKNIIVSIQQLYLQTAKPKNSLKSNANQCKVETMD